MALGIELSSGVFIAPDKNVQRKKVFSGVRGTSVNGFFQRKFTGINPSTETIDVSFTNRSRQDIDDLDKFLFPKKGIVSFPITLPTYSGEETLDVVCEEYTTDFFTENSAYTCNMKLRTVNKP